MQGYSYQPNWAPTNNNYGNPYTWQPTFSGTGSHVQGAPQMPRQQGMSNVIKVAGLESAKAFATGPNAFMILFEENNPIFYSKTTDDGGFPTIRRFRFVEEELDGPKQEQSAQTSTEKLEREIEALKEGFDYLSADISDLKKMLEGLVN